MFSQLFYGVVLLAVAAFVIRFWHPVGFSRLSQAVRDRFSLATKNVADSNPIARLVAAIEQDNGSLLASQLKLGETKGKIATFTRRKQAAVNEKTQCENRIAASGDSPEAMSLARRIAGIDAKLATYEDAIAELQRTVETETRNVDKMKRRIESAETEAETLKLKIEVREQLVKNKTAEAGKSGIADALEAARSYTEQQDGQAEVLDSEPEFDVESATLDDKATEILAKLRSKESLNA